MIRAFLTSRNVWIAAAMYAGFWFFAWAVEYQPLNVFVQCITLGVSLAITVAYGPEAFRSLISRHINRDDHLILGIEVAWLGVVLRSFFIICWRVGLIGDDADGMIQSDWINFFNFMIFSGGLLHITAPGTIKGRVPRKNWVLAGIAVGAGVMLGTVLLTFAYAGSI